MPGPTCSAAFSSWQAAQLLLVGCQARLVVALQRLHPAAYLRHLLALLLQLVQLRPVQQGPALLRI